MKTEFVGLMHEITANLVNGINEKKDALIVEKLIENEIEPEEIQRDKGRLFKKFARVAAGQLNSPESLYYNDGSVGGLRIITFVPVDPLMSTKDGTMTISLNYY